MSRASCTAPAPRPASRPRRRRTRRTLLVVGAAALAAQLVPWVHAVLAVLVAASWTLVGLLVARALVRRYGLHLPAWASAAAAARVVTRLVWGGWRGGGGQAGARRRSRRLSRRSRTGTSWSAAR